MDDEGGHATQGKPVAFGCGDGHDEPVAQQSIVFFQGLNQGVVLGYPGRPTSLGVAPGKPAWWTRPAQARRSIRQSPG